MKKLILTIALAVATISFCDAKAPIKGNGAEKSDARTIEPYSAISVADGIALNFSKDHLSGVMVTADENVLEHIVTEVVGGELLIHFKVGENVKPKKNPVVTVPNNGTITSLTIGNNSKFAVKETLDVEGMAIKAMGGAQIEMKIDARQTVQIELLGNAKCELTGNAGELKLVMEGGAKFNGYNFKVKNAVCELAGGSDAKVLCTDRIDAADLSGDSSLYFKGDCEIGKVKLKGGSTIGNR